MDVPRTHYLNADFDLSLRPRARRPGSERLERQIRELSVQGLLGAGTGDTALVREELRDEFLNHLASCGVPVPRISIHPATDPETRLRPFGWNAEAIELNRGHDRPTKHPAAEVVRRVNSRSFALRLEAELFPERASGAVVEDRGSLESFLSRQPTDGEWIVKSEFGNSALANRRLRSRKPTSADRRFVDALFAEDDRIVVEPWLARDRDWAVIFDVPNDPTTVRVHETIHTSDGALIGALLEPGRGDAGPWLDELEGMSEAVASCLEREGYFGLVCVDAFTWLDGDTVRLRPLVDLNCRRAMSDGAHRLRRDIAPDRVFYYRFFNRRKLTLPGGLPDAVAELGDRRYDPSRRRGVLLASPMTHAKLAVIFVAGDRPDTLALEREFRDRFDG